MPDLPGAWPVYERGGGDDRRQSRGPRWAPNLAINELRTNNDGRRTTAAETARYRNSRNGAGGAAAGGIVAGAPGKAVPAGTHEKGGGRSKMSPLFEYPRRNFIRSQVAGG